MKNVEKISNMDENRFCFNYFCDCLDVWIVCESTVSSGNVS
jgi:hypothetical protein